MATEGKGDTGAGEAAEGVRKIKLPWAPINTQGKGGNGADAEGIWFDCLQE